MMIKIKNKNQNVEETTDKSYLKKIITYRRLCPQPKQKISRFVLEIFYTKHIAFNWLSSYNNYQKKSIGASVVKLCSRAIRRKSGVFCNEYYRLETRKNQGGFINV